MAGKDNFRKYLTKEDLLQEACLSSCSRMIPGIPVIHVPNEGKRSDFESFKFKVLGGTAGVSDLLIVLGSGSSKGLWVELKCGKNKCTPAQMDFLIHMHKQGYASAVVYDMKEDFDLLLKEYQDNPALFASGIAQVSGEIRMLKYEEAQGKLVKKTSKPQTKRDAQKSFEKKVKARFGNTIKISSLPNAGKLFITKNYQGF